MWPASRRAGGTASAYRVDISQPEQIRPMIEHAVELWGGLHILVNNAWGTSRAGRQRHSP